MSNASASSEDANIVLKLYELRRESVMREARNWFAAFNPKSAAEILEVHAAHTQENAYFRQALSYWEMSAGLVTRGAVHQGLFLDWAGEMIFFFSKLAPFLPELREKIRPDFAARIEQVIQCSPEAQTRLARMIAKNNSK